MKLKVITLLERKDKVREMMRSVQDYGGKITDGSFKMPEGMDDEIIDLLHEYLDLLTSLIGSAEVNI